MISSGAQASSSPAHCAVCVSITRHLVVSLDVDVALVEPVARHEQLDDVQVSRPRRHVQRCKPIVRPRKPVACVQNVSTNKECSHQAGCGFCAANVLALPRASPMRRCSKRCSLRPRNRKAIHCIGSHHHSAVAEERSARGVLPSLHTHISPPLRTRYSQTVSFPCMAATCNGVSPSCPQVFTSHPKRSTHDLICAPEGMSPRHIVIHRSTLLAAPATGTGHSRKGGGLWVKAIPFACFP
jgi:hypothetical protein